MDTVHIKARPAGADELPRSAASLVKKANAAEWRHRETYAKGVDTGKKAQPVVESVMVKLAKAPFGAVAVWHDGSFAMGYAWVEGAMPKARGLRQITSLLAVA